jgi:hypothetical protein
MRKMRCEDERNIGRSVSRKAHHHVRYGSRQSSPPSPLPLLSLPPKRYRRILRIRIRTHDTSPTRQRRLLHTFRGKRRTRRRPIDRRIFMQRGAIRARQRDSAVWRGRRVRRRRRRRRSVDLPLGRREDGADAGADAHPARRRGRRVERRDGVVRRHDRRGAGGIYVRRCRASCTRARARCWRRCCVGCAGRCAIRRTIERRPRRRLVRGWSLGVDRIRAVERDAPVAARCWGVLQRFEEEWVPPPPERNFFLNWCEGGLGGDG